MAHQTELTRISSNGTLRLDSKSAQYVNALTDLSTKECWVNGQELLGLEYQWSTTDIFLMKGTNPPSIMLGIMYANPQYFDNLRWSLGQLDSSRWSRAWIVKSREAAIPAEYRSTSGQALAVVTDALGTEFPVDYELVASIGSSEFWAPVSSSRDIEGCGGVVLVGTSFPASVTNNMPLGWRPRTLPISVL